MTNRRNIIRCLRVICKKGQQYTSVVETDKTTDNLTNKEDTNWHNSLAGNNVSSTDVLKHKEFSNFLH
jgi:hypothetical protein